MDDVLEPEDLLRLQRIIDGVRAGLIVDLGVDGLSLNGQDVLTIEIQAILELQRRLDRTLYVSTIV